MSVQPSSRAAFTGGATILVVEDDSDTATMLRSFLEDEGHRVLLAENLAVARTAIDWAAPDLVVLDLGLPDGNGLELCAELAQRGPLAPSVLVVSARTGSAADESLSLGARDFVGKPFSLRNLATRVAASLRDRWATIDLVEARRAAEDAEQRLAFLAQASIALASSLDTEATLEQVARLVVPRVASACLVDILDDDGQIQRVAVASDEAHEDSPLTARSTYPTSAPMVAETVAVLRTGRAAVFPNLPAWAEVDRLDDDQVRRLRSRVPYSVMLVPIPVRGSTIGVISFISATARLVYGAADLAMAEDLAIRAGLAIENARHYRRAQEELEERRRAEVALRLSEQRFRAVWESAADAMIVCDRSGTILMANPASEDLTGYSPESIVGQGFELLYAADERATARTRFELIFETAVPPATYERTITRADGATRRVESHVQFLLDGGERIAILATVRDITERHRLQVQLERERARLGAIVESISDGLALIDSTGLITFANRRAVELVGSGLEVGRRLPSRLAEVRRVLVDPKAGWTKWRRSLEDLSSRPTFELSVVGPPPRDLIIHLFPLSEGIGAGSGVLIRDVTSLKQLARDEERSRIAMDLHDGTVQALYGVMLELGTAARLAESGTEQSPDAIRAAIPRIASLIDGVRAYIHDLRGDDEPVDLRAGLRRLADEASASGTLRVDLRLGADSAAETPPAIARHVLRVAQEAISNVLRHAQARRCTVRLTRRGRAIVLTVRDDGRGFDTGRVEGGSGGLGLGNIEARARLVGGRLSLSSGPGRGTEVRLIVPDAIRASG